MNQDDFVPAPIGRRILAFIFDSAIVSGIIYLLLLLIIGVILAFTGIPTEEEIQWKIYQLGATLLIPLIVGIVFLVLLFAGIWHGYFIYFEHIYQKTPAKKALGLFVVSANGNRLSFKQCVLREIFRCYVDMLFIFPALISMLCTQKKQRIGDMASGTLVLYSKNLVKDESFLYLSREQYELRLQKYRMMDCSLEEANSFLKEMQPYLYKDAVAIQEEHPFVSKAILAQDELYEDSSELKSRFVAEYLLQNRSAT